MGYAFYTKEQTKQYAFFQIPKALFKDEFKALSNDERVLYSMMRERTSLSIRNDWFDENGHAYIIYTLEEMIEDVGASKNTITKLVSELEKFGLIERKRRGQGLPTLIFVKDFARKTDDISDSQNLGIKNPKNEDSEITENGNQDSQKLGANKTKNNKPDSNDTPLNNNIMPHIEPEDDVVVDVVKEIVREPITRWEALSIAKAAGYKTDAEFDPDRIRTAYKLAEGSGHIENLVGYMISAIKEGYQAPINKSTSREKPVQKTSFHNFEERHTDYDALFREAEKRKRSG